MAKNPFENDYGFEILDELLDDNHPLQNFTAAGYNNDDFAPFNLGADFPSAEFAVDDFTKLNLGADSSLDLSNNTSKPKIISTETLEEYLFSRHEPEKSYGYFGKDITMCRYFESNDGENRLADIEQKNREEGMGNILIPDTNIRLINYSICPKCKKIFSFKELSDYYRSPKTDIRFSNPAEQARNDTRVHCHVCDTYFLPALIIADKTPKSEVQFLCRNQTMNAVELYFLEKGKYVLTQKRSNIIFNSARSLKAINNDISIQELQQKPMLIANILQYTPANLVINFIEGTNAQNGDVLFGYWGNGLRG